MGRTSIIGFIPIFILAVSLVGISSITGTSTFYSQTQMNVLDGIISDSEYDFNATFSNGDYILFWRNVGEEVYFGMVGKTTGWITIGIDPSVMMLEADMYFGWVTNTTPHMIDAYATGLTGPHPPDQEQGGTDDILAYNGTEIDGTTVIEFKRLLTTGDEKDKSLPKNATIKVIWAMGSSDLFDAPHLKNKGAAYLNLAEGVVNLGVDFTQPLILGISLFIGLIGLLIYVDSQGRNQVNAEIKNQKT